MRTATYIRFDVGSAAPIAFITLPISAGYFSPLLEWCRQALSAFTDEKFCTALLDNGLIELSVTPGGRSIHSIKDLTSEILTAVNLPGGISENQRPPYAD